MRSNLIILLLLLVSFRVFADTVEVTLPSGLVASAEYRHVPSSKVTLLIIHGFLATRHFRTVANLTNALYDEGYTVLSPTLTLGVDRRKVSLACEAIHTHTIKEDVAEIDFWVKWLLRKGHNHIVLIGHSYGSHESLMYSYTHNNVSVKKIIATSLVDVAYDQTEAQVQAQIKRAKKALGGGGNPLGRYQVSYCKKFVAPAKSYLSYASWNKEEILKALNKINIPVDVVLGEADRRVDKQWLVLLEQKGVGFKLIKGANHFFDAEHEFSLLESILASLKSVP